MEVTALSGYSNVTSATTSSSDSSSTVALNTLTSIDSTTTSYSSAFYLADSLKTQASSVATAFENANSGIAFTQVTNVALSKQDDILDNIKGRLLYIKDDTTTDADRESVREYIVDKLNEFDEIASGGNFNSQYYLQNSNSDNSSSLVYTFQISEYPDITLSTESIRSNTEGLGLTTLKNLSTGELNKTVANTQSGVVDTAIESIESFQSTYSETQRLFQIAVSGLDNLYTDLKTSENSMRNIDYAKESRTFDASKILSEYGSYSTSQANATQGRVSTLLSS